MRSPFVEAKYIENRLAITAILEAYGFVHFPFEFWHFNQGDAMAHVLTGQPAVPRFGPVHWDPKSNKVTAVDDPLTLLNPLPVIEREIEAAMDRAEKRLVQE